MTFGYSVKGIYVQRNDPTFVSSTSRFTLSGRLKHFNSIFMKMRQVYTSGAQHTALMFDMLLLHEQKVIIPFLQI